MAQHWIDEGLSWTPSDYDGMKEVTFGDSDVWTPTLSVHESYSVYGVRMFSSIKADYHGNVVWCPMVTFGLRCTMELRDFPFDEHRCAMNVSSWSHGYKIKLIGKPRRCLLLFCFLGIVLFVCFPNALKTRRG